MRTHTFTKGSGCYRCSCCGRRTRDDGNGDSVKCGLCTECFELSGIENMILDGITTQKIMQSTIDRLNKQILAKGGKVTMFIKNSPFDDPPEYHQSFS